jgi:hypothetical protein
MIEKPYSGKPNVRFDEGELEIEPFGYYASSLLYYGRCYSIPDNGGKYLTRRLYYG